LEEAQNQLAGIWRVERSREKVVYENDVLSLKLAHNPLFYIYKAFLDILIENDVRPLEIE